MDCAQDPDFILIYGEGRSKPRLALPSIIILATIALGGRKKYQEEFGSVSILILRH